MARQAGSERFSVEIGVSGGQEAARDISAIGEAFARIAKLLDYLFKQTRNKLSSFFESGSISALTRDFTRMQHAGERSATSLITNIDLITTSAAAAGLAVGGLTLAAREMFELGRLGAQSLTMRDSFQLMAQATNVATDELQQMRDAAAGTISTFKLLELANYSMVGVSGEVGRAIGEANDQLITIARAAYKARPSLGSVEFAYQSLIDGIKRLEKRLVDNLGLQVKAREANEHYAKSIGKSVEQLTAQEAQMAFLNEVLRAGNVLVQQMGGSVNSMADAFARAEANTTNLRVALGERLAPTAVQAADAWNNFAVALTAKISKRPEDELTALTNTLRLAQENWALIQEQIERSSKVRLRDIFVGDSREIREALLNSLYAWWTKFTKVEELNQDTIDQLITKIVALQQATAGATYSMSNARRVAMEYGVSIGDTEQALTQLEGWQDAYNKTLRSALTTLLKAGVAEDEAKRQAEEYATTIANLTAQHEAGVLGVADFTVSLFQADEAFDTVVEKARQAERAIAERNQALRSSLVTLLEAGVPRDIAPQVAETYVQAVADLTRQYEEGAISVTDFAIGLVDARRNLDAVIDATRINAQWQKDYDAALQSAITTLLQAGVAESEAALAADEHARAVAELTSQYKKGTISPAVFAKSLFQVQQALDGMADKAREARQRVEEFNRALEDAYSSTLTNVVRNLSELGAGFDEATRQGRAFAEERRAIEKRFQDTDDIATYAYELGQLDRKMQALHGTAQRTTVAVDEFADTLRSLVENNLRASFTVESLVPELAVREDEVDEHYRRLAAIAARGQEELDKHQEDWADTLALIPEDVRAQGIQAMQAWAKEKVLAYDRGLDFSLINRETLKRRILDALLAQEMRQQLVKEITAELGSAVTEAQVQVAATAALGGVPLGQITLGGITMEPPTPPIDTSAIGQQLADSINQSFGDSVDRIQAVQMTAQHILMSNMRPVREAGRKVGDEYVQAISDAAASAAPDIVNRLAHAIAPTVARILSERRRYGGAGGMD